MKLTLNQILAKYVTPVCGYAPGLVQVFYSHGGLTFEQASEIFGNCADYSLDGSGSGPSLFMRQIIS